MQNDTNESRADEPQSSQDQQENANLSVIKPKIRSTAAVRRNRLGGIISSDNAIPPPPSRRRPTRRRFLEMATGVATGVAIAGVIPAKAQAQTTKKRIYIAPDDHTDYMWTGNEEDYRVAFIEMIDHYLQLTLDTASYQTEYQSRWNCDGSIWMWIYERNAGNTKFSFDTLMQQVKDGHFSMPLNTLVGCYGATPTEGVLRGLYYAGRLERRYNTRFTLAVAMENQTLPYGLGSLWAGSGAKYSWRGVCDCGTRVPMSQDREHEIYWYLGPDGSKILMKWQSMYRYLKFDPGIYGGIYDKNENIGGYAEARFPDEVVEFVDTDPTFLARYNYPVIGAFGTGWDYLKTITPLSDVNQSFPTVAKAKSNSTRQVIVSNEHDFFEEFESRFGASLPTQAVTFGNEWELACASLTEVTAQTRRAIEQLRTAESLAAIVSLNNPAFMTSRITDRDNAFYSIGLFWDHNFLGGGPGSDTPARLEWQRRTGKVITDYVDALTRDTLAALGNQIPNSGSARRFYVYNPLGWVRTDFADIAYGGTLPVRVVDAQTRQEVPSQVIVVNGTRYVRVQAQSIPAIGYRVYELIAGAPANLPLAATTTIPNPTTTGIIENDFYRITANSYGVITSLIDKKRNNIELVRQINGRFMNDLLSADPNEAQEPRTGTLTVENVGAVSVTLLATSGGTAVPLDHTTRITLFQGSPRIDIRNEITETMVVEKTDVNSNYLGRDNVTWNFGFNLDNHDVHYEEVGAIIQPKYQADGGHYSPRNGRYDWQSMQHFADITGTGSKSITVGVTLSNGDCHFMRVGNSSIDGGLDTTTPLLSPLAGGSITGFGCGGQNQGGDTYFLHRFALTTHDAYNPTSAMRFSLEHQNPLVAAAVTGSGTSATLPASTYTLMRVSNENLLIWAVKPAEEGINDPNTGGIIVRLWNVSDSGIQGSLRLQKRILAAKQTTHIETDVKNAPISNGIMTVAIGARQLQTYRLKMSAV